MGCVYCQSETKIEGKRCRRLASCRIGCKHMCWQHAKAFRVYKQKGSKCNAKMLQRLEVMRRPLKGLGKDVYGISGSLSTGSMFRILDTLSKEGIGNATFVDIGAADGYVVIMAILYGYNMAYGIEYGQPGGLKHIYEHLWSSVKREFRSVLDQEWSPRRPAIMYNTNINDHVIRGDLVHLFAFWDGFTPKDSEALIRRIRYGRNIGSACLVRRACREYGTFDKIHDAIPDAKHIKTIKVRYGREVYNAVVFGFTL